jgi:hypothetical protein
MEGSMIQFKRRCRLPIISQFGKIAESWAGEAARLRLRPAPSSASSSGHPGASISIASSGGDSCPR